MRPSVEANAASGREVPPSSRSSRARGGVVARGARGSAGRRGDGEYRDTSVTKLACGSDTSGLQTSEESFGALQKTRIQGVWRSNGSYLEGGRGDQ